MVLYLLRPKSGVGPFQTVIYFPGGDALVIDLEKSGWIGPTSHCAYLAKSGRACAFPVYDQTFERGDGLIQTVPGSEYIIYATHLRRDLSRSLDYLESRPDIRTAEFGYFGWSWGGIWGPILLALEPRLKAAVLYVAGLSPAVLPDAADPFHFAPRVQVPVLLINAKYDQTIPLETHARPLFNLLGSEHKRHYISEGAYLPSPFADGKAGYGGHFVPQAEVMAETFKWFDEYLGPIDRDAIVMNTRLR